MEFFRRAAGQPASLAILAGAFHPPTRAHLALAHAALSVAGEVLFLLPRTFPHKEYEGADFATRLAWLEAAVAAEPRFSIGASEGGLFVEIAREVRAAYGPGPRLLFLCGRDAAERIAGWDYGSPGAFTRQLEAYELLVAARAGRYSPPPEHARRIHALTLDDGYDEVSSSDVRRRIEAGEPWEHLVPSSAAPLIGEWARMRW